MHWLIRIQNCRWCEAFSDKKSDCLLILTDLCSPPDSLCVQCKEWAQGVPPSPTDFRERQTPVFKKANKQTNVSCAVLRTYMYTKKYRLDASPGAQNVAVVHPLVHPASALCPFLTLPLSSLPDLWNLHWQDPPPSIHGPPSSSLSPKKGPVINRPSWK